VVRYIVIAFVIYLGYRFLFHFLIPVIKTTNQVKKGFREMHEKMQQQQNGNFYQETPQPSNTNEAKPRDQDYIDFEEIK